MAGQAQLDVVINLVSRFKDGIPGLKKDAIEVAKQLDQLLTSKPDKAGENFAAMFDFDGKNVVEQIKMVQEAIEYLGRKLEQEDIQEKLKLEGVNFKGVQEALKGVGDSAISSLSPFAEKITILIEKIKLAKETLSDLWNEIRIGRLATGEKRKEFKEEEGALLKQISDMEQRVQTAQKALRKILNPDELKQVLGKTLSEVFTPAQIADFQARVDRFFEMGRTVEELTAEGAEIKKLVKQLAETGQLMAPPGGDTATKAAWSQAIRRHKEAANALVEVEKKASEERVDAIEEGNKKEGEARKRGGISAKAVQEAMQFTKAIVREYYLGAEETVRVERVAQAEIYKARSMGVKQLKETIKTIKPILEGMRADITKASASGIDTSAARAQAAQLEALLRAYEYILSKSGKAVKEAVAEETETRKKGGEEQVENVKKTEAAITNVTLIEINKRIEAKKKEIQALLQAAAGFSQQAQAAQKGTSTRRDLNAQAKELRAQAETQVKILEQLEAAKAVIEKKGADASVKTAKAAGEEKVKIADKATDEIVKDAAATEEQLLELKKRFAKQTVKPGALTDDKAAQIYADQKREEEKILRRTEEVEREEVKKTADIIIDNAERETAAVVGGKKKQTEATLAAETAERKTAEDKRVTRDKVATDQLIEIAKTYATLRTKITQDMVDGIVAIESAGVKRIIAEWAKIQTALQKAIPKGETKQVIIEFKGKASPITDFTSTISYVEARINNLPDTHVVTIEFKKIESEIANYKKLWDDLTKASPAAKPLILEALAESAKVLTPNLTSIVSQLKKIGELNEGAKFLQDEGAEAGARAAAFMKTFAENEALAVEQAGALYASLARVAQLAADLGGRKGLSGENADIAQTLAGEMDAYERLFVQKREMEKGYQAERLNLTNATLAQIVAAERSVGAQIAKLEIKDGLAGPLQMASAEAVRLQGILKALSAKKTELLLGITGFEQVSVQLSEIQSKLKLNDIKIPFELDVATSIPKAATTLANLLERVAAQTNVDIKLFDPQKTVADLNKLHGRIVAAEIELQSQLSAIEKNASSLQEANAKKAADVKVALLHRLLSETKTAYAQIEATVGRAAAIDPTINIAFTGSGSEKLPISKKIDSIALDLKTLEEDLDVNIKIGNTAKLKEIQETIPLITGKAEELRKELVEGIEGLNKLNTRGQFDKQIAAMNELLPEIQKNRDKATAIYLKSADAIVAIEKDIAEKSAKVATTGEEKLAAAQMLRINSHRVAADRKLGIERALFDKIAALYNGMMKTAAAAKKEEIAQARAAAEERQRVLQQELEAQRRLASNAAFEKAKGGGSRYTADLEAAQIKIAAVTAELTKLNQKIAAQKAHEYVISVLLKASPAVPFSEGIANLKRALAGLPKEQEFTIKFAGLQDATTQLTALQNKLKQAQDKLGAALAVRDATTDAAARRSENARVAALSREVIRWQEATDKQTVVVTEMYARLEKEALDYYKTTDRLRNAEIAAYKEDEQRKVKEVIEVRKAETEAYKEEAKRNAKIAADIRKAELEAYKEDEKRKTDALKAENRKRADAIQDGLLQAKNAALRARKALDDALASGTSKQGANKIGDAYNEIKKEIKIIEDLQRKANRSAKDGNKDVANSLKGEVEAALKRVEVQLNKLGLTWDDVQNSGLNATKMWEDRMTSLSYRFSHVGFQLGIFGAAALSAFTTPIAATAELQKSLEYTNAILGGTEQTMKDLQKTALELGSTTIYSSIQVADGMKALAQAGLTAEQAMKGVKPILDFAGAGMLNLDDAARIAISTMNQFKLSLSDLPEITNNIQQAANKTNAEVKDFGEALKNVGPTAAAVGASLKDTNVALGVLSQAGINASTAGTQLRGVFRRLLEASNDTSKAGKIFKDLGISVTDAAGNFKDLEQILREFKEATSDMSEVERASKVYEIFGQRAGGPAVLAMLNAGEQGFINLRKAISEAADAKQIAEDRGEGLWGALEKLKNSFTALVQVVGFTEGSFLKGMIEQLIALTNAVRTAIENSPALKFLITIFMSFTAVAGAITAAAAAIMLMISNIFSLLGVSGPLYAIYAKLVLTLRGYSAAQIEAMIATKGTTAEVLKQTAAVGGLTASFNALSKAQKVLLVLAAIAGAIEIGRALYGFVEAMGAVNEQIENNIKTYEKFKGAVSKPITTKTEFALLTEEGKRKAIKHLAEFEQAYIAKISELENKIAKKKFWTFGFGDTKELKKELDEAKKQLDDAFKAERYMKIQPELDKNGVAKVKKDSVQLITDIDLLFGNTKLGIKKFDIKNVVDGLQKARDTFYDFEKVVNGAKLTEGTEELQRALRDMDIEVADSYASRLQSTRDFNQQALDATVDYFEVAMSLTRDWKDADGSANQEVVQDREAAYADTIAALDDMYDEAKTQMDKYSADIIKAEQDLAKERVDANNWYLEQLEVSDKLKTARRKQREAEERKTGLISLYNQQVADGDLTLAKKTLDEIQKLQTEINKAATEQLAESVKKGLEAEEKLAVNREKLADKRESRQDRIAEKSRQNDENELRRTEAIAAAQLKLDGLREKLNLAKTAKERLSITQQIEATELRIQTLERQASAAGAKDSRSLDRLENTTATEKSLERTEETLEESVATLNKLRQSQNELVKKSIEYGTELVKEKNQVAGIENLTGAIVDNQEDSKWIAEAQVALAKAQVEQLQAGLKVWTETAEKAKLTKATIQATYTGLSNLDLSKNIDEQLKKLKDKFEKDGIAVSLKAEAEDKKTFEILELATGKKTTIDIPLKIKGQEHLTELQKTVRGVQSTVAITANLGGNAEQKADDLNKTLAEPVTKDVSVNLKGDEAKKQSEELGKAVAKNTFVEIERDGVKYWTNFINEGEKVIQTMDLWTGQTLEAKTAGAEAGKAVKEGLKEAKVGDAVVESIDTSIETTTNEFDDATQEISKMFETVATNIGTSFEKIAATLQAQVDQAAEATRRAGINASRDITEEQLEGVDDVAAAQKQAALDSLIVWTEFAKGMHSNTKEVSEDIEKKMVSSHKKAAVDSAKAWEDNFFDSLIDGFKDAWDWLVKLVSKSKDVEGGGGNFGGAGDSNPDENNGGGRYGGFVEFAKGMATGGHLPGYGGGDRHPVLLESGEYVLPKEMVRGIGVDTLNSMRSIFLRGLGLPSFSVGIPRMAAGGPVGLSKADSSSGLYTLNLTLGGNKYPMLGRKDIIEAFMETMRREGMTKR